MRRPNDFDSMPDDEQLDGEALLSQLDEKPPANTPPVTAPTSNTLPVEPRVTPVVATPTGFDAQRVAPRGGGPPAGFDAKNWGDQGMQSVKYRAGRLLAGTNKPSDMAARVKSEEFQRAFPGATFDGKDRINFQGALSDGQSGVPVYDIDVLQSADREGDSSTGFWWGHDVEGMNQGPSAPEAQRAQSGSGPAGPSTPSPVIPGPQTAPGGGAEGDPLAAVMAEIQALQDGDSPPMDQAALMRLLGL